MSKIKILPSERVLFVGATGSGKTALAKRLLRDLDRVIIIDPKHTFQMDGFRYGNKLHFWEKKKYKLIVRPDRNSDETVRNLIDYVYSMGSVTIYVDELASLQDILPLTLAALENIARTGREKNVSLWTASQRPRWTPKIFFSETESFFIFGLRAREDREYIAGFAGNETLLPLEKYEFYYSRSDANNPVEIMTMDIQTGIIKRTSKEV